jgi:SnoaL-like domain
VLDFQSVNNRLFVNRYEAATRPLDGQLETEAFALNTIFTLRRCRSMEYSLQMLLDEMAIKNLHIRYCRGIDRMDWDLVRSCYHPDAIDDHGGYVGGVEGFIEYCKAGTPNFVSTTHMTGNQLVEVNGDKAWAEHYARAYHRVAAGPDGQARELVCNARYVDSYERRNGEWRISKRVVVVDSDRVDPVLETWSERVLFRGKRDKSDPSYSP